VGRRGDIAALGLPTLAQRATPGLTGAQGRNQPPSRAWRLFLKQHKFIEHYSTYRNSRRATALFLSTRNGPGRSRAEERRRSGQAENDICLLELRPHARADGR